MQVTGRTRISMYRHAAEPHARVVPAWRRPWGRGARTRDRAVVPLGTDEPGDDVSVLAVHLTGERRAV